MTMTAKRRHQQEIKRTRAKRDEAYKRGDLATAKRHDATLMDWKIPTKGQVKPANEQPYEDGLSRTASGSSKL